MEENKIQTEKSTFSEKFTHFNDELFSTKSISGIGTAGTIKLLRGRFAKFLNFLGRSLSYTSTRSYGSFLLSFGLLTVLLNFGEYYFISESVMSLSSVIIGAVVAALAVLLMFIDRPACFVLQDFPLTDYILFEFFSIKQMHRMQNERTVSPLVALFIGIIPAVIGYFVPVQWVLISIFALVFVSVALTSPEFPMILTLLVLPYLSLLPYFELILSMLSVITFISYMIKVAVGKRVFSFDVYTVFVLLMMAVILISGFSNSDTIEDSVFYVILLLGFFPASNLVVNRRLADCALNAIIVSAIPVTVIAIAEYIVELPTTRFEIPIDSMPGISSTFISPSALASFLIAASIITLTFSIEKKNVIKKIAYFGIFLVELVVLVMTMEPGAWISMVVAIPAYFIITSKKIPADVGFALFVIPHILLLLPTAFLDTVCGWFKVSPDASAMLEKYQSALHVFGDNILSGIGIGASVPDETNILLGIGLEIGLFGLVLFVFMLVLRLRHISHYRRYFRGSVVGVAVHMTTLTTVCLSVFGVSAYIFADYFMFYLFWAVFGLTSGALRTAKQEYDDRLGYYSDSKSAEATVLDVELAERT